MNKKLKILILVLVMALTLTSCGFDESNLTQTHRPRLKETPIKGFWEIGQVLISQSRFGLDIGSGIFFDVDVFILNNDLYTNPSYEVQWLTWSDIKSTSQIYAHLDLFEDESSHHLIRIRQRSQPLAEIILKSEDKAVLSTGNQVFEIDLVKEDLTEDDKALLVQMNSRSPNQSSREGQWAVAIGYRQALDTGASRPDNFYQTLLVIYDSDDYKIYNLDGILIGEKDTIDHYTIRREVSSGVQYDNIYLNGEFRPIMDVDGQRQANLFNVNYLSNDYLTLEYLKDKPNTLSTYSTRTKGGFTQLNSDDIIDFSSGRIYELSRNINNLLPMSQATYNIGFTRENGLSILKSRLVTQVDGIMVNRDFALSGDFSINDHRESKYNMDRRLKADNPQMKDFYSSPDENKVVVIDNDSISIYNMGDLQNREDRLYSIDENVSIVSFSSFKTDELEMLEDYIR